MEVVPGDCPGDLDPVVIDQGHNTSPETAALFTGDISDHRYGIQSRRTR